MNRPLARSLAAPRLSLSGRPTCVRGSLELSSEKETKQPTPPQALRRGGGPAGAPSGDKWLSLAGRTFGCLCWLPGPVWPSHSPGLKTTAIPSRSFGARGPKAGVSRATLPPKAPGAGRSRASVLAFGGGRLVSKSCPVSTWLSTLCVRPVVFLVRGHPSLDLGPGLVQEEELILT